MTTDSPADSSTFPEDDDETEWVHQAVPDSRTGARQIALQALYWEASSPGEAEAAVAALGAEYGLTQAHLDFSRELTDLATSRAAELDEVIEAAATHWKRERLARIDGLILRLAIAEILYLDSIPVRASIDEAVELAKLYGGPQSYAFVNGVLDAIARQRGLAL